jgi:CRP-like cAMP-binding protein
MSLKQEFEVLRRVPMFAEIEPAKLKLLAVMCQRVGFEPGSRLMRQGDLADAAYLIIDGHAEIILETPSGPVILATVGTNEIVGEVGILSNAPRRGGGPCQRSSYRTAHPKGAVYAHGARIPDRCGLDNAGLSKAAPPINGTTRIARLASDFLVDSP